MLDKLKSKTRPFIQTFTQFVIENTSRLGERRLLVGGIKIETQHEISPIKVEGLTNLFSWVVDTHNTKWECHVKVGNSMVECLHDEILPSFPLYITWVKTTKKDFLDESEQYGVPVYRSSHKVAEETDAVTLRRDASSWSEGLQIVKRGWDEMVLDYQQEVAKQAIRLLFSDSEIMTHSFIPKETLSGLQPNQYIEDNQRYLIIPTHFYLKLQAVVQIKSQQVNILVKVEESDTLPDVHYSAEVIGILLDMNGADYIYPIKTVSEFEHYVKSTGLSEKVKLNGITLNDCTFPHDNRYYQSRHNRLRLSGDFFGKQYTLRDRYTASPTDNEHGITWYLDISYPTVLSNKWVGQCLIRLTGVDTNRKLSSTKTLEWDNGWLREDVVVSKTHVLYLKDFNEIPYIEQIQEQLEDWLPGELTSLKLMHWDIH